ncbi:MAG: hypothetical protein ABEJ56_01920 [Candidatus Nanohaloarchaea archaeon]
MVDDETILGAFGLDDSSEREDIEKKVEKRFEQLHDEPYRLTIEEFHDGHNYSRRYGPNRSNDYFGVEFEVDAPENAPEIRKIGIEVLTEQNTSYPNNVREMAFSFPKGEFEDELEDTYGGITGNIIWYDPQSNSQWDAVVGI